MIVPDLVKAVADGQKKATIEIQGKCFMNERLQELYLIASEQFKIVQDQGLPVPYQTRAFAGKFAELIVRECLDIASEVRGEPATDTYYVIGYDRACEKMISGIKEHFGINTRT